VQRWLPMSNANVRRVLQWLRDPGQVKPEPRSSRLRRHAMERRNLRIIPTLFPTSSCRILPGHQLGPLHTARLLSRPRVLPIGQLPRAPTLDSTGKHSKRGHYQHPEVRSGYHCQRYRYSNRSSGSLLRRDVRRPFLPNLAITAIQHDIHATVRSCRHPSVPM
jgi:hypothetical protein